MLLGLASSGAHSNGYSLIRKIVAREQVDFAADFHGRPMGDVLMTPTRIYVKSLLPLIRSGMVRGLAHITGGGLIGNVPRVLPKGTAARLDVRSWTLPPLFAWLQDNGGVSHEEMHRTFNCGIGMVMVVAAADAEAAMQQLQAAGETVYRIGEIVPHAGEPVVLMDF